MGGLKRLTQTAEVQPREKVDLSDSECTAAVVPSSKNEDRSSETADPLPFLNTTIRRRKISREQHFTVLLMPEVKGEWTAPAIKTAMAIQTNHLLQLVKAWNGFECSR